MRNKIESKKVVILVALSIILAVLVSACELQQVGNMPATPTMEELEIPILAAETKAAEEEAEAPAEEADAKEVAEETSDEDVESEEVEEEEPAPAPTETPKPQPTATEKPAEADAEEEETEEAEEEADAGPTPTEIPYVQTSNNDPMVMVYMTTNCYENADLESEVMGVAVGGSALGAFERDWNWYKVVHPTVGGLTCWVTGDSIHPNQTAFNLGD